MSVDVLRSKVSAARRRAFCAIFGTAAIFCSYQCAFAAFFWWAEDWAYVDAIYFCVVTSSTVGYGDMMPSKWYAKLVNVVFIAFGITIFFANLSALVSSISDLAAQQVQLLLAKAVDKSLVDEEPARASLSSAFCYYGKRSLGCLLFFCALHAALALPYTQLHYQDEETALQEQWWTFGGNDTASQNISTQVSFSAAVYFSWITATTVGYGFIAGVDDDQRPAWLHPYLMVQLIVSVSALAGLTAHFSALASARRAKLRQQEVQRLELTEELIAQLDRDGDGVDKLEFVVGMLSRLDLVHWHDVKPLLDVFERFDADGSGRLTATDVIAQMHGEARPKAMAPTRKASCAPWEMMRGTAACVQDLAAEMTADPINACDTLAAVASNRPVRTRSAQPGVLPPSRCRVAATRPGSSPAPTSYFL